MATFSELLKKNTNTEESKSSDTQPSGFSALLQEQKKQTATTTTSRQSGSITQALENIEKRRAERKEMSFADRYMNFSQNLQQNVAVPIATGLTRTVGSTVGGMQAFGEELVTNPISKFVNKIVGVETKPKDTKNIGETINTFVEEADTQYRKLHDDEKKYIDYVLEGLGSSAPFLLTGIFGKLAMAGKSQKAVQSINLMLNLGISGSEALVNAYDDYEALKKSGDKRYREKALASFATNVGINYVTNKLGFLSEPTLTTVSSAKSKILEKTKIFIASTLLELNQESLQSVTSDLVQGKKIDEIWPNVIQTQLVTLPIAALFGAGGVVASDIKVAKKDDPFFIYLKETSDVGATKQEIVESISTIFGVDKNRTEQFVDVYLNKDEEIQAQLLQNEEKRISEITQELQNNEITEGQDLATDMRTDTQPTTDSLAGQEDTPLIQEARKYKSAEEFVRAQGTSVYHGSDKLFTTTDDIKFGDDFFYTLKRTDGELKEIAENVTADSYYSYDDLAKMPAKAFGENVSEFVVKFKNPKIIDAKGKSWLDLTDGSMSDWTAKIVDQAKKSGEKYDGIIIKNIEEGFSSKGTLGVSAGLVDDYIVLDKSALQTKSQLTDIWEKANQKTETSPQQPVDKKSLSTYNKKDETITKTKPKSDKSTGDDQGKNLERIDRKGEEGNIKKDIRVDVKGITRFINENPDGFTVSLNGEPVTTGFAVSPYKDRELVIDNPTEQTIYDFISKNEDLLFLPDNYLGGWRNSKDGKYYLDVSVVKQNIDEAIEIAQEAEQKAVFGFENLEEIFVDEYLARPKKKKRKKTVKVPPEQLPVGDGKTKVSRLEARVKNLLDKTKQGDIEKFGLSTYQQMNKASQIERASEYVTNNEQEALDVLSGKKEAPDGLLYGSIMIAMQEKAAIDENVELALKLSTLRATRFGQEISILTEADTSNPVNVARQIAIIREDAVQRKLRKKPIKTARAEKVSEIDKVLENSQLKIAEAEKLLDSLLC